MPENEIIKFELKKIELKNEGQLLLDGTVSYGNFQFFLEKYISTTIST